MNQPHISVLLDEVVEGLKVKEGGVYVDATLGAGGHAAAIIKKGGHVVGLDQDPEALKIAQERLSKEKTTLIQGNFKNLKELVEQKAGANRFDGILFDLGVSSMQLDTPERGFSFKEDAPLDMRMSPQIKKTAKDIVNTYSENELYRLFKNLGGESQARIIAQKIVEKRRKAPIESTLELSELIQEVKPYKAGSIHPATKVFQALRIEVNQELSAIKEALPQAVELLKRGGRLAVISFHEGEDRIVKNLFNQYKKQGELKIITKKPITPDQLEINNNPRARSAKLRIAEKE